VSAPTPAPIASPSLPSAVEAGGGTPGRGDAAWEALGAALMSLGAGLFLWTRRRQAHQPAMPVLSVRIPALDVTAAFAGPAGPRRLALITCGGDYDPASASYDDNVYVFAVPAPIF
jgi:hypothetical protein